MKLLHIDFNLSWNTCCPIMAAKETEQGKHMISGTAREAIRHSVDLMSKQ